MNSSFLWLTLPVYRVTEEVLLTETVVWPIFVPLNIITALKGTQFSILFAITAAVVVPCSGPQIPSTSSIRQIIF